jgi:hypothetical protein
MKSFIKIVFGSVILSLILAACGASNENNLIGSWKVVMDDNVLSYMEINEDRIVVRKDSNDGPMTADYILTETEDEHFILEFVNPETGTNEFIFEGYFDNKDSIIVTNTPSGEAENYQVIRVDNIAEDQAKEEKRLQEQEEKEAIILQEQKEKERANEKEEKDSIQAAADVSSLKQEFLQKADDLDNKIIEEAKKLYAHDMKPGFYGQYYGEWDDLLQEVWGVLGEAMPKEAFEKLKSDQKEWINNKEGVFAEMPDEHASSRAEGMDFLANETADRTYYLIENYMD